MPKFWWTWGFATVNPFAQKPMGSRYRWNSRVSEIYKYIWIGMIPWSHILR